MMKTNSFGSFNSVLSFSSVESYNVEDKNVGSDDETKKELCKYSKIGSLTNNQDLKESICNKHYDEQGNKYYNEYKFISFLGSGAFSKIELVEKDGVKYAMKIIDKEFLKSQKNMEFDDEGNLIINTSFENALKEIAILKKTDHPNIIKLYEIMYCPKNKKIYLILEACEHGDLMLYDEENDKFYLNNKYLESSDKKDTKKEYYSNSDIYKFLNDIIAGLYYLHANGIIHRDIKPNNILLDKNNVCKITDFNVSTILEDLNVDNIGKKICSADHFRPPEACNISLAKSRKSANDVNVDNKIGGDFRGKPIDIWALGVTAYILAYNKFPFESKNDSVFELYEKIYSAKFEFPEYPTRRENIKKIITRCLEKDPNKRITIEELSKFSFIDKSGRDSIIKWNSNKKIKVIEKEILKSINFLCPPCKAIYQNMKTRIKKEIDISRMTFESFKGKTFTINEKYCTSIEDKYGVFVVDGFIFRKADFGMKSYMDEIEEKKKMKKKCCKNYKKYYLDKSNIF